MGEKTRILSVCGGNLFDDSFSFANDFMSHDGVISNFPLNKLNFKLLLIAKYYALFFGFNFQETRECFSLFCINLNNYLVCIININVKQINCVSPD